MIMTSFAGRLPIAGSLKYLSRRVHTKVRRSFVEHSEHSYHHLQPFQRVVQESVSVPQSSLEATQPEVLEENNNVLDEVMLVQDKRTAADIVDCLMSLPEDTIVAWDTETTGIDVTQQSPVGNGSIICATAYAGDYDVFGERSKLFVDCLDSDGSHFGELLDVFKGYFENRRCKKVWHNYSFDRHMFANHGIDVKGFAGDSMHMARLVNTAEESYSLEALCKLYFNEDFAKTSLMDKFGRKEMLKNGKEGKRTMLPDTIMLQTRSETRKKWIDYATKDAELTHRLSTELKEKLKNMQIGGENIFNPHSIARKFANMYELHENLLVPFGELLTDMESAGFRVDVERLRRATKAAQDESLMLEERFREWASKHSPDARYMNIRSPAQKQFFFFAPFKCKKDAKESWPRRKSFLVEPETYLSEKYVNEIRKKIEWESEAKVEGVGGNLSVNSENISEKKSRKKQKLKRDIILQGLGKTPVAFTAAGWPSINGKALQKLAEDSGGDSKSGENSHDPEMSQAIRNLIEASQISTLIGTFLKPLQEWPGKDDRIHASLNLNTETGRLSSRRPNLQNQPALEKDRYQIRKAFVPDEGKTLIVADYGQLELRLLAHITNCKSMIEAFNAGGDFHSRTALSMFKERIGSAIERGECVLERKEGTDAGHSPPLLKEVFATERKMAKTLNFSIAYGKTVKGLAKDWNKSTREAQEILNLWYDDRPEVKAWQRKCRQFSENEQYVETILGRRRNIPDIRSMKYTEQAHAERAAINAPLQGSAADLVMAAMVKLHSNRILQCLGWKIILQVHDEIILEGPDESADIALPVVVEAMKDPIGTRLLVDLAVDAKCAKSWYDAK